jgi:hypothetical protein
MGKDSMPDLVFVALTLPEWMDLLPLGEYLVRTSMTGLAQSQQASESALFDDKERKK